MSTYTKQSTWTEPAFLGADQKEKFLLVWAPEHAPANMIKISVMRSKTIHSLQNQAQFTLLDVGPK